MRGQVAHELDDGHPVQSVERERRRNIDPDKRHDQKAEKQQNELVGTPLQAADPHVGEVLLHGVLTDHILSFELDEHVQKFGVGRIVGPQKGA